MNKIQVKKQDYEGPREKGGQNAGRSQSRTGLKSVRRGTALSVESESCGHRPDGRLYAISAD